MYLEISGRCSGKTTRLIKAVIVKILESKYGQDIIVVGISECVAKFLEKEVSKVLPYYNKEAVRFMGQSRVLGTSLDLEIRDRKAIWFYDEFDRMAPEAVVLGKYNYYSTTPKESFSPIMSKLIDFNGGHYYKNTLEGVKMISAHNARANSNYANQRNLEEIFSSITSASNRGKFFIKHDKILSVGAVRTLKTEGYEVNSTYIMW